MKLLIFILLLIPQANATEAGQMNKLALESYQTEAYDAAIGYWEELENNNKVSANLYFNLGNAHYKNGAIGKAIYYYEKTLKLKPNHQFAKDNIDFVSNQLKDDIEAQPGKFINRTWRNVAFKLKANTWTLLSILTLYVFCGALLLFLIHPKALFKRIAFLLSLLFFVLLLLFSIVATTRHQFDKNKGFAIVLQDDTPVKNKAQKVSKQKYTINEGAKVEIVERKEGWFLIKIADGREGWLSKEEIGVI